MAFGSALALAMTAGGCGIGGVDGVQLEGGVFDALGLSGSSRPKLGETKVEARPGLVLPPTKDHLPDPVTGSIEPPAPQGDAWPVDAKDRKQAGRADLERRHKEVCEREIAAARLRGETSGVIMGPMGNCQPGLFGSLGKQFGGRE